MTLVHRKLRTISLCGQEEGRNHWSSFFACVKKNEFKGIKREFNVGQKIFSFPIYRSKGLAYMEDLTFHRNH